MHSTLCIDYSYALLDNIYIILGIFRLIVVLHADEFTAVCCPTRI